MQYGYEKALPEATVELGLAGDSGLLEAANGYGFLAPGIRGSSRRIDSARSIALRCQVKCFESCSLRWQSDESLAPLNSFGVSTPPMSWSSLAHLVRPSTTWCVGSRLRPGAPSHGFGSVARHRQKNLSLPIIQSLERLYNSIRGFNPNRPQHVEAVSCNYELVRPTER